LPQEEAGNNTAHDENENENADNRNASEPPSFKNGNVDESQLMRYFPHRKSFRRMKTWAGMTFSLEVINKDDYEMLAKHPSLRGRYKKADEETAESREDSNQKAPKRKAATQPRGRPSKRTRPSSAEGKVEAATVAKPAIKRAAKPPAAKPTGNAGGQLAAKPAANPLATPARRNPGRAAKKK
jgi:hypothetical protein